MLKGSDYMSKRVEDAFEKATLNSLESIETLEAGSDERSRATNDAVALYKASVERQRNTEDRWFKVATIASQLAIAIGGWVLYDKWSARGMKFEEKGTVSSMWTRNLNSKMTPKI